MERYDIYGLGAALVDTELEVTDEDLAQLKIDKGVMTLVSEDRQHEITAALKGHLVASTRACGGSAANSVIAARYFGAEVFYSCKVADDENGAFYLQDLARAGVSYHSDNGSDQGITGKCLVMITPDAERTMNTFLGVSATLAKEDIDEGAAKNSRYVYIEGYLVTSPTGRPAAVELRRIARENGVKTAVSLSDPAIVENFSEGLREIIGNEVDIIFCNEAEALAFTRTASIEEAAEALKQVTQTFAITRGARGSLVFDGHTLTEAPASPVKAVDSNGAGDMYAGAFLYALTQERSYTQAAEFANRAAAKVVSQFGPRLQPEQYRELMLND